MYPCCSYYPSPKWKVPEDEKDKITAVVSTTLLDIHRFRFGRIAGKRVSDFKTSCTFYTVITDKTVYRTFRRGRSYLHIIHHTIHLIISVQCLHSTSFCQDILACGGAAYCCKLPYIATKKTRLPESFFFFMAVISLYRL